MIICSKLSEIALQLELALGHAESMTESNDTVLKQILKLAK
jgi:hypothetical protein